MDNTISRLQCSGCERFFAGMGVFDKHHIGEFGKDRRCMTDQELIEAGMNTEKKNVRLPIDGRDRFEEHDVWFDVEGREKMRTLFANKDEHATS